MKQTHWIKTLTASALILYASSSWAACKTLSGSILLTPEFDTCSILDRADTQKNFPSLTFLYSLGIPTPTCFTSQFNGQLNGREIRGKGVSGMTLSSYNVPQPLDIPGYEAFTAATTLGVRDRWNNFLGFLYFTDTGIITENDPYDLSDDIANERLVIIGGTGIFQKVKGHIDIVGNEFNGANVVQGTICD